LTDFDIKLNAPYNDPIGGINALLIKHQVRLKKTKKTKKWLKEFTIMEAFAFKH